MMKRNVEWLILGTLAQNHHFDEASSSITESNGLVKLNKISANRCLDIIMSPCFHK